MKFFKKSDLIVIAALLLAGGLLYGGYLWMSQGKAAKAQIYMGDRVAETIELQQGQSGTISIPGKEQVVFHLYEDGSIAFEKSDCPDKVCINSGKLNRPGQSAACLPNGLILKIVPAEGKEAQEDLVL